MNSGRRRERDVLRKEIEQKLDTHEQWQRTEHHGASSGHVAGAYVVDKVGHAEQGTECKDQQSRNENYRCRAEVPEEIVVENSFDEIPAV